MKYFFLSINNSNKLVFIKYGYIHTYIYIYIYIIITHYYHFVNNNSIFKIFIFNLHQMVQKATKFEWAKSIIFENAYSFESI